GPPRRDVAHLQHGHRHGGGRPRGGGRGGERGRRAPRVPDRPRARAGGAREGGAALSAATDSRVPIAVLVSGAGSNLRALSAAAERPGFPARIVLVVAN